LLQQEGREGRKEGKKEREKKIKSCAFLIDSRKQNKTG
jgi:hypothetical protein